MRHVMVWLAVTAITCVAAAQMSPQDAMSRLRERALTRNAATSQPTTRPGDPDTAVRAIQSVADDVDALLLRGNPSKESLDACLERLRGHSFRLTALATGVATVIPIGSAKRALLVQFALNRVEAADGLWHNECATIERRYNDEEKNLNGQIKMYYYDDPQQVIIRRRIRDFQVTRDVQLQLKELQRPDRPLADVYLVASDSYLDHVKPGQSVYGTIAITDAWFRKLTWKNEGDGPVTYADKFVILGKFLPDSSAPAGANQGTLPPATQPSR